MPKAPSPMIWRGQLDAATITDHRLISFALVFAADTCHIPKRPKDSLIVKRAFMLLPIVSGRTPGRG
jgi:hypothetical protein